MSTEVPYTPNVLPAITEDVFRSALVHYTVDRFLFHEQVVSEVDSRMPEFVSFAEIALDSCDIDEQGEFMANDYFYVMGALLCRQAQVNRYVPQFARALGTHTASPIQLPPRQNPFDYRKSSNDNYVPFPSVIYSAEALQAHRSIGVLEARGLVATRPGDTMNHIFSGDYFLDDFDSEDRRFVGESALRLYGLMNHLEQQG